MTVKGKKEALKKTLEVFNYTDDGVEVIVKGVGGRKTNPFLAPPSLTTLTNTMRSDLCLDIL